MKLKLNTIILLMIAIVFGGGVLIWEQDQSSQPQSEEQSDGTQMFDFSEDQVEQLTVITAGQTLTFKLSKQGSPPKTTWLMTTPKQVDADEAAIAFLLNLLATSRSSQTLEIPMERKQEFGLTEPVGTIQVTLRNQKIHTIVLGKQNFNQSAVYAEVDPTNPKADPLKVDLLPTSFLDAIDRPIEEWEQRTDPELTPETAPSDPN